MIHDIGLDGSQEAPGRSAPPGVQEVSPPRRLGHGLRAAGGHGLRLGEEEGVLTQHRRPGSARVAQAAAQLLAGRGRGQRAGPRPRPGRPPGDDGRVHGRPGPHEPLVQPALARRQLWCVLVREAVAVAVLGRLLLAVRDPLAAVV